MTRLTCRIRNLKEASVLDGNYLCEGGVELGWKVLRRGWIDESEGKKLDSLEKDLPEFNDLLQRPGSSKFTASGPTPGMTQHEYGLLLTTLAPFESDGPENTEEWNLFDTFLSKDKESWHDPHDLGKMLKMWEISAV